MLDSLFPFGFILVAILAFGLFALGGFAGVFLGVGLVEREEGRVSRRTFNIAMLVTQLVGIVLAFLYYHFTWDMICRQFAC